ncbi:hypothetical protein QJS10_CPA05g01360 [Acorus calamus]|uniref:Uncharacterized protein n=1 Tax=Acorus calamus TaxID=4465 RepID=A0AAV9EXC7_ACOCL|nr:hypothetical protein QJS10_CPA05g01350 [Acorus calamus]KAK1317493.1 hypothetical protein QJS10_CPA05g01360 [Acorus calamus]
MALSSYKELVIEPPKSAKEEPESASAASSSPIKGGSRHCLCSPTTHEGSFRCRFHRSSNWMRRSKSMPRSTKSEDALSHSSVEST